MLLHGPGVRAALLTFGAAVVAADLGAQNIVANGSFEQPVISSNSFAIFPSIPGWTDISGCGIEIQSGIAGAPDVGAQFVELDSNCSSTIVQTVTTAPGVTYALSFDFSPRPGVADNHVQIKWGSTVVADVTADGSTLSNTRWLPYVVTVTATSASTTLSLADLSVSDGVGTYIDNVQVVPFHPIPTLSPGGIAALGLILGAAGVFLVRRSV